MNFKYGYENISTQLYMSSDEYGIGIESLLDDADMSLSNTVYSFRFESCDADLGIFVGMEANNDTWYKKIATAIVNMFKAIGGWFKSAWNWIKKKFGFGGSNDVPKVSKTELNVKAESASKSIEKIEKDKEVTPEKADAIVEETVTEVVKENKAEVDLTPIIPQIVEEVKTQIIKLLEPIEGSVKDIKSSVDGVNNKVNGLSKKIDDISKIISNDDLKKVSNEIKTEVLKIAGLQKEVDLKSIVDAVKKEIDRVISTRKDVNLRSIVPEIVSEVKKNMPKQKEINYSKLSSSISKELSNTLKSIGNKIPDSSSGVVEKVAESIAKTAALELSSVSQEVLNKVETQAVEKAAEISKQEVKDTSYTQEQKDVVEEVVKAVVTEQVKTNVEDVKKDTSELTNVLKAVIEKKIEGKGDSIKDTVKEKVANKLTNRANYRSSTIAKRVSTSSPLTISRQDKKIEFTTYLFSDRVISNYNSKFKKFSHVYNTVKGSINMNATPKDGGSFDNIKGAVKLMACSILYMGGLADMLFSGVDFNSDGLVKLLSSDSGDFVKEIGLSTNNLGTSLNKLIERKAVLDLVEVKFDIPYSALKGYDKSMYQRMIGNNSKILSTSVEISKVVSDITNVCINDINELDKFVAKMSAYDPRKPGSSTGNEKDIRDQFSYLKGSLKSFKAVGTNLYKLLYNSNIVKVRKTLKTHDSLS